MFLTGRRPQSPMIALTIAALAALAVAPGQAQDKLVLDGSTGMLPLASALAAAYRRQFHDAEVAVGTGLGTRARLEALTEGRIQIALASHGLKPEDVRAGGLKVFEVARGAVVFAVNETVPLAGVTEAQVCDLYSGKLASWRGLGGGDAAVALFTRPATEVDAEVVRAKIGCYADLKEAPTAQAMPRSGDMAKALAATPNALGITSMTVVEQSAGRVKALTLNGVAPTPENVRSGRYVLTREYLFVVQGEPAGATKKFLDFVRGPEGERILLANGAVPVR